MNKEKLDKLYELANVAVLINPKLIDEKAFIEEVCSILEISQQPKCMFPDIHIDPVIHWYDENRKPIDIKLKHESTSVYGDPEKMDTDEPDKCFKSTGVAEMQHVTTC